MTPLRDSGARAGVGLRLNCPPKVMDASTRLQIWILFILDLEFELALFYISSVGTCESGGGGICLG